MALSLIKSESLATGAGGSIIQVQHTQFTGTSDISIDAATDTVLTDLTVNITPTSTSSIIKIEAMVNGEWSNADGAINGVWFFFRDTTKLSHAAAGNRPVGILMNTADGFYALDQDSTAEHAYYSYFDTPSTTSQITYKVGVYQKDGYDWSLNMTQGDTDNSAYERGISNISVTEIAG